MAVLTGFVTLAFRVYALGLLASIVLSWADHPRAAQARRWLDRLYLPFLNPLRTIIKPVPLGKVNIDLCPWIMLIGIDLLSTLVVHLLS